MKRRIKALLLIIIITLEITIILKKNEDFEKSATIASIDISSDKNELSLKEIFNELEKKEDIEIQNVHKEDNSYFVKGIIKGDKDEFKYKLNSLGNFKIVDYSLELDGEEVKGTFTLNYSTLSEN